MKMKIDRRALLGGLAASLAAPRYGFAASVMDATGRTITAPEHVLRVYPAGPPAAVELYTLAPDLLIGWVEPIGQDAREFLLPEIAARPQVPRLTGRGSDNVNLDALTSLKPELIVDIGNVNRASLHLPNGCSSKAASPTRCLMGISIG